MFETKRLILREWRDSDIPVFAAMNQDPKVMEFFPATLSLDETKGLIERIRQHFKTHGFGLFAVELKATGEFIGVVGLMTPTFEAHFTPCVEIGWRIASAHWKQGYATEAAKMVLQLALEKYGLKEVVSFTAAVNLAGVPGISIQCGFSDAGLPIGFQLIGPHLSESKLFQVGHAYQQITDWHTKNPTL